MPIKKIGEGAQARYNAKKPTIAFRAPSVAFKQRVVKAARDRGISTQEFMQRAIGAYMEAALDAQRSYLNKTENLKASSLDNAMLSAKHHMEETIRDRPVPEKAEGTKKAVEQINWDEFGDIE